MISDVITGYDGKRRCGWAGAGDTALGRYHDEVWGTRTHDESAMFEALTLGVFEVGLSWSVVFGKRDAFRTAFRGFDVAKVAAMTEGTSSGWSRTLRSSETVPRSRRRSTTPARCCQGRRAWRRSRSPTRSPASGHQRHVADLPASTPQAEAFAKQLKSQGYRFVGPTSVYAFMQNVGVVNDHVHGCFRASD